MYPGIGRGPVFWWCTIRIIYHLVHHLQTPLTELNIVYMWGFLITVEVMTPPEPDRCTCWLLVPGPQSGSMATVRHHQLIIIRQSYLPWPLLSLQPLPKPCLLVHPRKIFTYQKTYMYTQDVDTRRGYGTLYQDLAYFYGLSRSL